VATYSTGISVSWGGTPFTEMYEVGVPLFGSPRKDRAVDATTQGWTDEVGDISVVCYGTANMSVVEYGKRKQLVITGGGFNLTQPAVCTGVTGTPELNGVTRYTFTAKLLDG
jgi:hypothetical protein